MTILVQGADLVSAWKAGAAALLQQPSHRISNLITDVTDPIGFKHSWLSIYDPKSVGAKDRLSVVAKVLFPLHPKKPTQSRDSFYSHWNRALNRNRKLGNLEAKWGTYFGRLTQFGGSINQLDRIITALATWKVRPEAALLAHLSSPQLDSIQPIGSPCLQYLEFLWRRDDSVDLVAVYRNHDFLNKSLGNLIGLARVLEFVTSESGKQPGKITCHSVQAYCDAPTKLARLVAR